MAVSVELSFFIIVCREGKLLSREPGGWPVLLLAESTYAK